MTIKLKIKIEGNESRLQILEQDESLRDKGVIFKASNGWQIKSLDRPQISWRSHTLFLRGASRRRDHEVISDMSEKMDIEGLEQCLNEWRENDYQIKN